HRLDHIFGGDLGRPGEHGMPWTARVIALVAVHLNIDGRHVISSRPAGDEATMQPAKRRRGLSAVRILINDKPVDELTPKLVKSLMLAKVQAEVKARVLTPAEATESYIKRTKRWITIATALALVLMAAVVIAGLSYEPQDAPVVIPVMLLSVGGLILLVSRSLRRRVRI